MHCLQQQPLKNVTKYWKYLVASKVYSMSWNSIATPVSMLTILTISRNAKTTLGATSHQKYSTPHFCNIAGNLKIDLV